MRSVDKVQPIITYLEGAFCGECVEWADDFDRHATRFRVRIKGQRGLLLLRVSDEFIDDNFSALNARLRDLNIQQKLVDAGTQRTVTVTWDGTPKTEPRPQC